MSSVEFENGAFSVDAALIAEGLGIGPTMVQPRMRDGTITSRCERGEGDDAGRYRLTFFHGTRRLQLVVDAGGKVLEKSATDAVTPRLRALRRKSP
jgi:hypothetical protein